MSKALAVLKVFFSLVSINSTESPSTSVSRSTSGVTGTTRLIPTTLRPKPSLLKGEAIVGQPFRIPVTEDLSSFLHGDITKFEFKMKTIYNGSIGPKSWVQFNSKTREVYGFPLPRNAGIFPYIIKVSNRTNALLLKSKFQLSVKAKGFETSHEVSLTTGTKFPYIEFMTSVNMRTDFVGKLARYCFNEKPSSIWIKTFSPRRLTVAFVNIPYSPCLETTYSKLKSKLVDENSNIKPQFQKALTKTFPVKSAQFKFFGSCDPNMFGPEKPFEWGWWKHLIPVAMILGVVGIPVSISCFVNRRRKKSRVVEEPRRFRTLRPMNGDGTDLTSRNVHFSNGYPSMVPVANNSKDSIGDHENAHGGKSNIPNGSPTSRPLTVPNTIPKRPKQGGNATNTDATTTKKNPFKFASAEERANFDVRAMWDDDNDAEQTPLDIPTYYTYKNNEEEEPSMMDAVLDMNFSDIAENISTKLKGVKSLLNIQGEAATAQETKPFETKSAEPSLSTKLKGLGKSMLNLSTNDTSMVVETPSDDPGVSFLSTKLRDFGKSMLNLSLSAQGEDKKDLGNGVGNRPNLRKGAYHDSDDNDSYIYKTREYDDTRTDRHGYGDARRSYDGARQNYDRTRNGYDESKGGHDGLRQSYDDAERNCDFRRDRSSVRGFSRHVNRRHSDTSEYEFARNGYDNSREGYDGSRHGYNDALQYHNHARQGYDDSRRSYDDAQRNYDFRRDRSSGYGFSRHVNRRHSDISEYELAQYNFQAFPRTLTSEYQQTTLKHHESYRHNPSFVGGGLRRQSSREHDFDEYPDSLFDAISEHSLKSEHEKSIFDTDFDDTEEDTSCLVKPTPIWNHSPVSKERKSLGLTSFGMNDVKYQDYTNPHQYSNGPTRAPLRKPSYRALGTYSFSSQSTLDFWDDEGFDAKTNWKQSSDEKTNFLSSFTNSVPDLRRGHNKGNIPNGMKPQSKSKHKQGNSLLSGSLLTGEKPPIVYTLGDSDEEEYQQQQQKQKQRHQQQQQQQGQEPDKKSSFVGLIKTGVSSILEPDSNVSKWFSGFQKSENSVT